MCQLFGSTIRLLRQQSRVRCSFCHEAMSLSQTNKKKTNKGRTYQLFVDHIRGGGLFTQPHTLSGLMLSYLPPTITSILLPNSVNTKGWCVGGGGSKGIKYNLPLVSLWSYIRTMSGLELVKKKVSLVLFSNKQYSCVISHFMHVCIIFW